MTKMMISHHTTFRTCSHRSPTYQHARLQQQQPLFYGPSGDSEAVRSLSLLPVPGIAYLRN